ncbi:hypothetical protein [Phenylobacterium sp.]|uniref:hypothetical protein n=1 Tax=Phenylobacterium sp. TaxID=1871053 RepID=UPI0025CC8E5A|nr:hypothetical protein [Phenylobacterium sp.]
MIDADALHEAEQQALGQLAQMDLALAARLHALAMASDDPKEIADHTRSYQRAGRCVRQTIMLAARLRHDRERHRLATTPSARFAVFDDDPDLSRIDRSRIDPGEMRVDGRVMDLQEAASRIVAQASPPDTPRAERLDALDRIDAWIDREIDDHEDFGVQDLDEHVLSLCRAFNLPEALGRRYRDLPRAPREEDDPDPGYTFEDRRSDTG